MRADWRMFDHNPCIPKTWNTLGYPATPATRADIRYSINALQLDEIRRLAKQAEPLAYFYLAKKGYLYGNNQPRNALRRFEAWLKSNNLSGVFAGAPEKFTTLPFGYKEGQ